MVGIRGLFLLLGGSCFGLCAKAQLVFRNEGADTIRLAVATFYDTSQKAIMSSRGKPVIVKGWYKVRPGDSLVYGAFIGPAVYYRTEIFRDCGQKSNRLVVDRAYQPNNSNYKERLLVDNFRPPCDTTKFQLRLPPPAVCEAATKIVYCDFETVLLTKEAKRAARLVITVAGNGQ
jgi:hypothetical protein